MAIFNFNKQFDAATPIIPRNREYEKPRASNKRRDITTQVRDWLYSKGLTETWIKPGGSTIWYCIGRPILQMSVTPEGYCQIVLKEWAIFEIGASSLVDSLSSIMVVKCSRDLKLVKPFLRLALDQPEWAWLRDVDRIRERLTDERMIKLEEIFIDGIDLHEEAFYAYEDAA